MGCISKGLPFSICGVEFNLFEMGLIGFNKIALLFRLIPKFVAGALEFWFRRCEASTGRGNKCSQRLGLDSSYNL